MIARTALARMLAASALVLAGTLPQIALADAPTRSQPTHTRSSHSGAMMTTPIADFPLIPREALFGNPTKASGQISPDGTWLSWLAPREGVLNIWIAPRGDLEAAKPITRADDRPILSYFWSPDGSSVMYIQDKGGDENYLLYKVDIATGAETTLTPFENTRVQIIAASDTIKDKLLIGLNNRDPQFHDVYLLDIASGALELVYENTGYAGFEADESLTLRMALRQNAAGGTDYFAIEDGIVAATAFETSAMEDALTTRPAGYTTDGAILYWLDSRGRNTAALFAQDTATGERTLIAEDDKADLGGTIRDIKTGKVLAYSVNYLTNEWTALDPAIKASFDWLGARLEGEFGIASRTDDDAIWIVTNDPLTAPTASYIYDRTAGTLTPFYTTRPELEGMPLQAMHPVEIASRDGLTLPSYLTLPPGSDSDGDGRPDRPVPLVLLVHGGPWARDGYGFGSTVQWLANRGYGVLQVNFRGSTGFGKNFLNAGNLQWGRKMQDDLIDATRWAINEGITAKDQVAIMGGSYGGYATLAGLAFTPDTFACGVDIVGPSNLETLLSTIPPYWAPQVKLFHTRMGDPNTAEGLALLRAASPIHQADRITRPLLILQGANDPRVKQAESDQIVGAMKAAAIPVTYVLYPDEGHGFAKPANAIAYTAITENFLATCIGGRSEPIGAAVAQSTAQILEGAEHVAGLTEALGG